MRETLHLAGFFAAHGVWCVSAGETLCPLLGWQMFAGDRLLDRLENEKYEAAVAEGRAILESNPNEAERMVLLFDGFTTLDSRRMDALFVEAIQYLPFPQTFTIVIPYRHARSPEGFAVHRPKLLAWNAPGDFALVAQFFQDGIDLHEEAAAVWSQHLDQSV
jgi:hypothetical protein